MSAQRRCADAQLRNPQQEARELDAEQQHARPRTARAPGAPHRGVLALHAAAVEADGGHPLLAPLHPDHALVVLLARLRLWQVLGPQCERLHDTDWDQEVPAGQDLGATLRGERP